MALTIYPGSPAFLEWLHTSDVSKGEYGELMEFMWRGEKELPEQLLFTRWDIWVQHRFQHMQRTSALDVLVGMLDECVRDYGRFMPTATHGYLELVKLSRDPAMIYGSIRMLQNDYEVAYQSRQSTFRIFEAVRKEAEECERLEKAMDAWREKDARAVAKELEAAARRKHAQRVAAQAVRQVVAKARRAKGSTDASSDPGPIPERVRLPRRVSDPAQVKAKRSTAEWIRNTAIAREWSTHFFVKRCALVRASSDILDRYKYSFATPQAVAFRGMQIEIELQSGAKLAAKAKRDARDQEQREKQKQKKEKERKSVPKSVRERHVREARDKRSPIEVELQSGAVTGLLSGLVTTAGISLIRTLMSVRKTSDIAGSFLDDIRRTFRAALDGLKTILGPKFAFIPLVIILHHIASLLPLPQPARELIRALLTGVTGVHLARVIVKFFPEGDTTTQAGMTLGAGSLMATLMTFAFVGKKSVPSMVTELTKRISVIERAASGWDALLSWTCEAMGACINWIRRRFGKERLQLFKDHNAPMKAWAREIDAIILEDVTTSTFDIDKLIRLIQRGYEYKEIYRGTPMERYVSEAVIRATNTLVPHQGALNARNNFRFEPVSVMFMGAPGIGKTLMCMPFIAAALIKGGLIPADWTHEQVIAQIWSKGNSEFWNGYLGQMAIVFDDWGQQKADSTDKDNEYMNVIRMVGSWAMPLNFADVASKGKFYFNSKLIFGTTNTACIESEARQVLNHPDAVVRRIAFPYQLTLKDEYKTLEGRLDTVKFEAELRRCATTRRGAAAYPWHVWSAQRHDFLRGTPVGEPVELAQVLDEVADLLRDRSRMFNDTKTALGSFIETVMERESEGEIVPDVDVQATRLIPNVCRSSFNTTFDFCMKEFNKENNFARHLTHFAMPVIAFYALKALLLPAAKALWDLFSRMFGRGGDNRSSPNLHSNRKLGPKKERFKKENDISNQAGDMNVINNVYNNSYTMYTTTTDGAQRIYGAVTFIEDALAVQPQHFTEHVENDVREGHLTETSMLSFRHAFNEKFCFSFSAGNYLRLPRVTDRDNDVEFLDFSAVCIRAHRNVRAAFVTEKDLRYLPGARARVDRNCIDNLEMIVPYNIRRTTLIDKVVVGKDLIFKGRRMNRYVKYPSEMVRGDCGALVSLFDNTAYSGRAVFGIHAAGSVDMGIGFCAVVTQEMIEAAQLKLKTVIDHTFVDLAARGLEPQASLTLPFREQGSFLPLFMVPKPVTICPKTSYYPVKQLYGKFGEYDYLPAPLSMVYRGGEPVYPMDNALEQYASPVIVYEQPWLDQAVHVALRPLTSVTSASPRIVYTFEEAILGVPQEKFRSIPRGTAAGYPYVLDGLHGKKEFFGDGDAYDLTTPKARELRERVDYILYSARNGIRLAHIFVDFLKDELRSKAKVDAVQTRLISSAPLDYVVAWRMMFGAFSAAVMRNHTVSGMAPGICAFTDWDQLANHLQCKGKKVFDGDFKFYDSSEQPTLHAKILDYINDWYDDGPDNRRARSVLWLELCHSRHIGGRGDKQCHIYQWNKSLPSGHPFTTIVNSMYSLILIVGAYISLTGDLVGFWDNVSTITYGDDNVSNVNDTTAHVFNQTTLAGALMREFCVRYTSGHKDAELTDVMTLDEVTFLKRGFRREGARIFAALELDSFLYTCYWCKNRKLEAEITLSVLENALEELSLHDQSLWDKYAPMIVRQLELRNHVPKCKPVRKEYQRLVCSRDDNWY